MGGTRIGAGGPRHGTRIGFDGPLPGWAARGSQFAGAQPEGRMRWHADWSWVRARRPDEQADRGFLQLDGGATPHTPRATHPAARSA